MRGVSQRTKDIIALAREILAEDQPGAFGACSLAPRCPKWTTPTNVSREYPLPRFPQATEAHRGDRSPGIKGGAAMAVYNAVYKKDARGPGPSEFGRTW
jgi:hypothetical protein